MVSLFRILEPLKTLASSIACLDAHAFSGPITAASPSALPADPSESGSVQADFLALLSKYSGEYVCILPPIIDFHIELFQRPQQIALALSSLGILSVYITPNIVDKVETATAIQENLVLLPNAVTLDEIIAWIKSKGKKALVEVYSTDIRLKASDIERLKHTADALVYEYIDEISEAITGVVPDFVHERHQMILQDPQICVLSTAARLHAEVVRARNGEVNCLLSSNGVDLEHFQNVTQTDRLPLDFAKVVSKKKPIVGYFGAIAPWLDFALLRKAALARPQYEFVLIGFLFHGLEQESIEQLQQVRNITLCKPIDYQLLPQAAIHFSVATIPFLVNSITESTSPIKIFEYMAMGKPVVTTEMPECHKYPAYVAQTGDAYIQMLDRAMADIGKPQKIARLLACAKEHSWCAKAMDLMHIAYPHLEARMEWLILSAIDWDFRYQRPQQLAAALSSGGDHVTYVNTDLCDTLCTERRGSVDLIKFGKTANGTTSIFTMDSLKDAQPLIEQLDAYLTEHHIRTANVLVEYPTWYPLAKFLKEKYDFHIFFDYIDEYDGFTNTNTNPMLKSGLAWLKENSKAIFATSQYLYDRIGNPDANKYLIRNGTESARFLDARSSEASATPVIGYYGAIADWFDTSLIAHAAKALPACRFIIVGDYTYGDVTALKDLPNVQLTGEVPYHRLTEHLRIFDVCLIPFKASLELIKATNPVKFYEYLSAGKKVVATEIPELEPFRDRYVLMSNDPDGFTNAIRRCLENRDGLACEEERIAFGRENDWQERTKIMRKAVCDTYPRISVVVLTWNNADYNIACIRSIYDYSAYPNLEVIVVDNASTDGTPERLRRMASAYKDLKLILNEKNLGFAAGMNQGIHVSTGEYIVFLNNDTIVTSGWLSGLKRYADMADIGLVGSVTNEIGNEAKIEVTYPSISEMQLFAAKRSQKYAGECFDIKVVALFCTMIRRIVLNEIGELDEQFKVGMFEDDDYSLRIQKAGYRTVCATDVFIHHYGRSSFKQLSDQQYLQIFNTNRKLFEKKHGQAWQMHVNA